MSLPIGQVIPGSIVLTPQSSQWKQHQNPQPKYPALPKSTMFKHTYTLLAISYGVLFATTCAAAPANCPKQETDIDYYGNDIKTIKGIPIDNCCDACSTTNGCVGYTFVEKNSDGQTACYLKSGVGGRRPTTGAVSGELKCPTQPYGQCGTSQTGALCCPQGQYCQPWNPTFYQCIAVPEEKKCPTVVTGIDFYGSDLEVKYGLQPGECCDACYNSTTCHVYTFINYREGSTACYLKSAITEQRANTAAISGYKNKLAIVS